MSHSNTLMKNNNFCKIIVAYHKPSFLLKSDIFLPINVGRALNEIKLKKGLLKKNDISWLNKNTIGDDTGDNISAYNYSFNELTAVYWAWKHYDEIGNPKYIGLCHYRRIFEIENGDFETFISDNDLIAAGISNGTKSITIQDQFLLMHKKIDLDKCIDYIAKEYPDLSQSIEEYFHLPFNQGYFYNMFLIKKDLFFEYCDFLFSVLMYVHKNTNYEEYSVYGARIAGFLGERLSGAFFYHCQKTGYKLKVVEPIFLEDYITAKELVSVTENNKYSLEDLYLDFPLLENRRNEKLLFSSLDCSGEITSGNDEKINISTNCNLLETGAAKRGNLGSQNKVLSIAVPYDSNNRDLFELTLQSLLRYEKSTFHCKIFLLCNALKDFDSLYLKQCVEKLNGINTNFSVATVNIENGLQRFSKYNLGYDLNNPQLWFVLCPFLFSDFPNIIWINRGVVFNKAVSLIFDGMGEHQELGSCYLGLIASLFEKAERVDLESHSDAYYNFSKMEDSYQTNILIFNSNYFQNFDVYKSFLSSVEFNLSNNFFYLKFSKELFKVQNLLLLDYRWSIECAVEYNYKSNYLDKRLSLNDFELYFRSKANAFAFCLGSVKWNKREDEIDYLAFGNELFNDYSRYDAILVKLYKELNCAEQRLEKLHEELKRIDTTNATVCDLSCRIEKIKQKNHKRSMIIGWGLIIELLLTLSIILYLW